MIYNAFLLEQEGITFNSQDKLDLRRYRWQPDLLE